jgi:hypothetical protein
MLGAGGADSAASVALPLARVGDVDLPSAIPAFLEACAKMAGEAAARGDYARAHHLIGLAARVGAGSAGRCNRS